MADVAAGASQMGEIPPWMECSRSPIAFNELRRGLWEDKGKRPRKVQPSFRLTSCCARLLGLLWVGLDSLPTSPFAPFSSSSHHLHRCCLLALAFTLFVICWRPLLIFFGDSRTELRISVQCPLLCVLLADPADHSATKLTTDAEPSRNPLALEVKAVNTLQSKTQWDRHPS